MVHVLFWNTELLPTLSTTALSFAVRNNDAEIVKILLEAGSPVDAEDGKGYTIS